MAIRATQGFVGDMGFCRRHPLLTGIEIGWRWLFGIPFLWWLAGQLSRMMLEVPTQSVGFGHLSFTDPWTSARILAAAAELYAPYLVSIFLKALPIGLIGWCLAAGLGRTVILSRMERQTSGIAAPFPWRRVPAMVAAHLLWLVALTGFGYLWLRGIVSAARDTITSVPVGVEPHIEQFLIRGIFITLALYVLWAAVNWVLTVVPVLLLLEGLSLPRALLTGFAPGRELASKLVEVNMVMHITKIALLVLALVFSSAPLPFSDELGTDSLRTLYEVIAVIMVMAQDYFHVVRLRSYCELWRACRRRV